MIDGQELKGQIEESSISQGKIEVSSIDWPRGFRTRPGSLPWQCTTQCGKCKPCILVYVTVHPRDGNYYPLRALCKCRGRCFSNK
ncbi:hypothetical protein CR513_40930, partial [Mucuna pruriens]